MVLHYKGFQKILDESGRTPRKIWVEDYIGKFIIDQWNHG